MQAYIIRVAVLGYVAFVTAACQPARPDTSSTQGSAQFELRLADTQHVRDFRAIQLPGARETLYVSPTPIVTSRDVVGAAVTEEAGAFSISLDFRSEAAERLKSATARHVGKPLAIVINGQVVSAPVVQSAVSDSVRISGAFTRKEAEELGAEFDSVAKRNRSEGPFMCKVFGWC